MVDEIHPDVYLSEAGISREHDDVIKWKHFPRYWPFVWWIHRWPGNSPHKGQWRGALVFSLICAWINAWVNNCQAGDLRRHRAHYNVIVMELGQYHGCWCPRLLRSPGNQQRWYCRWRMHGSLCFMRNDFNCLHLVGVENLIENANMCLCSIQNKRVKNGLPCQSPSPLWCIQLTAG